MSEGAPQVTPTPICASCGVVAPPFQTCESCAEALGRVAAPLASFAGAGSGASAGAGTAVAWAAVRASFACRSCGFPSPLEGLVVADGIDCEQCASFQRFDRSAWTDALEQAHSLADLGGPDPEGRFPNPDVWIGDVNPYAEIGVGATFATATSGAVKIEACPGFPVCKKCKRPFDVRIEGKTATTTCAGCGVVTTYALPKELAALAPKVVAAVAEGQRQGRVEAHAKAGDAGVVTLTCPQCGAALKAGDGAITVECSYCHALAFIPSRARPKGPGRIVAPIVFFVAFQGPSTARKNLELGPSVPRNVLAKAKSVFTRGLAPLPGIELAPVRPGVDVKQLLLTVSLSVFAVGVAYGLTLLFE